MRVLAVLASLLLFAGCSNGPATEPEAEEPEAAQPASPTPEVETSVAAEETITNGEIPTRPGPLAIDLVTTTRTLKANIDSWMGGDGGRRQALFGAMRQQRIFQLLAARPNLFDGVEKRLPSGLARFARETVGASSRLRSLVTPLEDLPDWKTYKPAPAGELHRYYRAGQRRFGIPWQILASLNFVESRFGRILGPSSAGAEGPMQFIPSTWDAYGNGGDINDPHDAILAAARYLRASGAPERMRDALFAYNRSYEYVHAIRTYARQIGRDARNYRAYYFWQVYVLTVDGNVQLTGPGGARPARA
jgi:hypothetical protein